MKIARRIRWYVLLGSLPVVSLFMLATAPNAFGCDAGGQGSVAPCPAQAPTSLPGTHLVAFTFVMTDTPTVTTTVAITTTATITPTVMPKPTAPPTPTPSGSSPEDARVPMFVRPEYCIDAMCQGASSAPPLNAPGPWEWINANSSTWYKAYDNHNLQLQLWLFANGQQGLAMDVYAPDQTDLYGKPIGRGGVDKSQVNAGVDLFYSGHTMAGGVWRIRVTNNTSVPMWYSLRYSTTTPSGSNSCDNCHKYLNIWFDQCNGVGNYCEKLNQVYQVAPDCFNHDVDAALAGGCK